MQEKLPGNDLFDLFDNDWKEQSLFELFELFDLRCFLLELQLGEGSIRPKELSKLPQVQASAAIFQKEFFHD